MNSLIGKQINILDNGWIELQDIMGDDLAIVNAARASFLGESKGNEKDKRLLFYLMEHYHTGPFEQVEFKFRVKCPLFVARQWMRHRTWSYNELSRRYTSANIEFYIPDGNKWRKQSEINKQASDGFINAFYNNGFCNGRDFSKFLTFYCEDTLKYYNNMLDAGVAREMARMILPSNMYTEFIAKVDAHNLMHFLSLRMSPDAQYEIRVYAEAIYEHFFKPALPWTSEAFEKYRNRGWLVDKK